MVQAVQKYRALTGRKFLAVTGEESIRNIRGAGYVIGCRSQSRWAGGAGLGLPLVRDIVNKHGGTIEIQSVFLTKGPLLWSYFRLLDR